MGMVARMSLTESYKFNNDDVLPDKVYVLTPHNKLQRLSFYMPSPDVRHRYKIISEYVPTTDEKVKLDDVLEFLRGDSLPNGPMYARNLAAFVEAKFGGAAPELASGT